MPRSRRTCSTLLVLLTATAAIAQPPLAWVGRYADMEAHLRTAEVVRLEDVGTGVTRPRRAFLEPGTPFASLTWKVLPPGRLRGYWESYKSEIAAYELDTLLELHMVPPTVERVIRGETGAAVMWIDGTKSVADRGGKMPTDARFGRPIRRMQLFDNVIGNPDRNAGNILIDASSHMILIDHSRAFVEDRELPFAFERVDAGLWAKVKTLTREQLSGALAPWLDAERIDAMLERRRAIASRGDELVKRRGASAVIIP